MAWDLETLMMVLICVAVFCVFVAKEYAYNCLPKSHFLNGLLNRSSQVRSRGEASSWRSGASNIGGDFGMDDIGGDLGTSDIGGDCGE